MSYLHGASNDCDFKMHLFTESDVLIAWQPPNYKLMFSGLDLDPQNNA